VPKVERGSKLNNVISKFIFSKKLNGMKNARLVADFKSHEKRRKELAKKIYAKCFLKENLSGFNR